MKDSYGLRKEARAALSGNWKQAILTGFVASLIGATITASGSNYSSSNSNTSTSSPSEILRPELIDTVLLILSFLSIILVIWGIAVFIIGGAGKLGYAKFNLNLIDKKPATFSDLFSQFDRIGAGFCMNLLVGLYTVLWTLLFIIPGIVKSYSYAMTPYILSEHPEMTATEAIAESRRIMNGNKWRLFSLRLSFIGWDLLCAVPILLVLPLYYIGAVGIILGLLLFFSVTCIGSLLLIPYKEATNAAFYRDISQTSINHYIPREIDDSYRGQVQN